VTRFRPRFPGEASLLALRDPLTLVSRMAAHGGDVVQARIGHRTLHLLCDPALVRALFAYSGDALRKERALRLARFVLGDGPLTSEGERHREQRRRLRSVFHRRYLRGYGAVVLQEAAVVFDRWRDDQLIDPYDHFRWLTVEATAAALFGRPLRDALPAFWDAVDAASRGFDRHRNPTAWLLARLPTPGTLRLRRAAATLRRTAADLVDGAAGGGAARVGPLAQLLAEHPDREQALDEAVTLLLAGHETTAVALTWCCWLLAGHPEAARRVQQEADALPSGAIPEPPAFSGLGYTRQVIAEAMRVYPPVWAVSREAIAAVRIGQYDFRPGAVLMVSPFALHRDPHYWPEPERFDPDRFAASVDVRPFLYVPFSGGVRGCMGEGLAWTECVLALSVLVRRWRLERVPGEAATMRPGISLRPSLRMRVRRRP
jgi:cytochrome P450